MEAESLFMDSVEYFEILKIFIVYIIIIDPQIPFKIPKFLFHLVLNYKVV